MNPHSLTHWKHFSPIKGRASIWWMAVFVTLTLLAQGAFGEDWHCRNGKTYKDVRYMRHNLSAVQFAHSSGIAVEKFSNLPKDIQERYGYDPQKEERARVQHQKELEERQRKAQELQAEKDRQEAQRQQEWIAQQAEIQKQKKYECIEVKTDEFRDITTVHLKDEFQLERNGLTSSVYYIVATKNICMRFTSMREISYGWRFLDYHPVYFLIDGERWQPKEDYDSDIFTHSLYESISIWMPLERMESIVHAQSVRFKIGITECSLSQEQQGKMNLLFEYLRENYNADEIIQQNKQIQEIIQRGQIILELHQSDTNEEPEIAQESDADAN